MYVSPYFLSQQRYSGTNRAILECLSRKRETKGGGSTVSMRQTYRVFLLHNLFFPVRLSKQRRNRPEGSFLRHPVIVSLT